MMDTSTENMSAVYRADRSTKQHNPTALLDENTRVLRQKQQSVRYKLAQAHKDATKELDKCTEEYSPVVGLPIGSDGEYNKCMECKEPDLDLLSVDREVECYRRERLYTSTSW
jgi:hypothetical protein